jgi:excisionase family DNA binding protein
VAVEERCVGADRVAAQLRVTKDSIERWIEAAGLPAHHVSWLLRLRLSEVDRLAITRGRGRLVGCVTRKRTDGKSSAREMAT